MTSLQHLVVIGLMVLLPLLLAAVSKACKDERITLGIARGLALALIANKAIGLSIAYQDGALPWRDALPMHLCDWSLIATITALLTRWQLPYEMAYFWGLAGGTQAILTPDINVGFEDIRAWSFFISHAGGIASVLYLTFALPMRPHGRSMLLVFLWSQVYLAAAISVNVLLDANYGYLCAKPRHPSLLDHMGPWPYYILSMELLALFSFLFYYAPFFLMDQFKGTKAAAKPSS
jgi:hypothetical integral membrane protein (TIGR02206 family)